MKFNRTLKTLAVALLVATAPLAKQACSAPNNAAMAQQTYAAPEDAARALVEALRSRDQQAMQRIAGPGYGNWLSSGDAVADQADQEKFLAAYDRKNAIARLAEDRAVLLVGESDWPFPAPLVKKEKGWVLDTAAGREEINSRRVGRNELDTIQTLLAIVDAQREYASSDPDGNGFNDYAQRFVSREGQRDGLYWPAAANDAPSPLGPLVGSATREGYGKKVGVNRSKAYHGYRYRILKAQGQHAPGGQYEYLVNGKLLGGFAIVAYPVKYGVSGVMTFMVSHDGTVFQKNLGRSTASLVQKMQRFDPDAGWQKSQ